MLGQFADTWDRFPEERQARLARGAERWAAYDGRAAPAGPGPLPAWRELDDGRRDAIRERAEAFRDLSPEEQQRIRKNFHRYRQMNQDRRQQLRDRYRRMTPEQRQRLRDRLHQRPPPRSRDGR